MKRFTVIENKKQKSHVVIDTITGQVMLDTENPETARKEAEELNWLNDL